MHPKIILAIARKDMLDVLRNRTTLFALLTPIFVGMLYWVMGVAISAEVTYIAVYNPGNSALVTKETLPSNKTWSIVNAPSAESVSRMVENSEQKVSVGVVVPPDADAQLRAGGKPKVDVYFHATRFSGFSQQMFNATLMGVANSVAGQGPLLEIKPTLLKVPAGEEGQVGIDTGKALSRVFALVTLLIGLISAGMMLLPTLLVEEKEKKTLRLILSAPAGYADVIAGKLLVGLVYTVLLSGVLLLASNIAAEALPQVLLFLALGAVFFLLVGLTLAAFSRNMTEVNTYGGIAYMLAMVPIILSMPGSDFGSGTFGLALRLMPNYYLTDGMRRALEGTGTTESVLFNAGMTIAVIVALFGLATMLLRRQQLSTA